MKNYFYVAILALATVANVTAQAPQGWKMRVDRSTSASDPDGTGDIKFVTMGTGFHATNPKAAVYWNPANTASGAYTVKGTFKLMKPSGHANFYGLVFGGSGLEGAQQNYLYFVVAQNGMWLVKGREADATSNVAPKTANDAVKKPDASGESTNALRSTGGRGKSGFRDQRGRGAYSTEDRSLGQDRWNLRNPRESSVRGARGRAWGIEVAKQIIRR